MALARITIVACMGGLSVACFWWFFGRFGGLFGFPGAATLSPWLVGVSAGIIAGCGEAWRIVINRRDTRMNREIAGRLGCDMTETVSGVEIRSWPQVCLFRNDSPTASSRMTGMYDGRRIDVFDFKYSVTSHSSGDGSSSSTSSYTQTVYRFPQAAQGWSHFLLKPRHRMSVSLKNDRGVAQATIGGAGQPQPFDHALTAGLSGHPRHQIYAPFPPSRSQGR